MDVSLHLQFFTHDMLDPVIWLRIVRVVFFLVSALLMFKEPMMCEGKNKWFHWQLALLFLGGSLYSFGIAKARMEVVVKNPQALVGIDLLAFEIIYTALIISVAVRLGYDYYKYVGYNKVKHQEKDCGGCPKHFQP